MMLITEQESAYPAYFEVTDYQKPEKGVRLVDEKIFVERIYWVVNCYRSMGGCGVWM